MPIDALLPADSPRLDGENEEHCRALAEVEADLPPILVHRGSLRVIDGMHRLRVAAMRGDETIRVRFFDGSPEVAFVIAVEANVAHGLPLTLADREAATRRIIASHPEWSDRAIAIATGLAARTVGAIRQRVAPDEAGQVTARLGRDGRVRPLNPAEGRRLASYMITSNPDASIREIARVAGVSPGTVRDVRDRMRRGDDPVPARQRMAEATAAAGRSQAAGAEPTADGGPEGTGLDGVGGPDGVGPEPAGTPGQATRRHRRLPPRDRRQVLGTLRTDPSIRFTNTGRLLFRYLEKQLISSGTLRTIGTKIPPHCTHLVAEFARGCAEDWREFAEELEDRAVATG